MIDQLKARLLIVTKEKVQAMAHYNTIVGQEFELKYLIKSLETSGDGNLFRGVKPPLPKSAEPDGPGT